MITNVTYPDKYCFTGNPMSVYIEGDAPEETVIEIKTGDTSVINLSVVLFGSGTSYRGKVDIARYLSPFFKKAISGTNIVDKLDHFALEYSVSVKAQKSGTPFSAFNGRAFYGGINKFNYQWLRKKQSGIFEYRFLNPERQFLFTTRTNSNHFILSETELYPLAFIHPGGEVSVTSPFGKRKVLDKFPEGTVCSFDMQLLRKAYFEEYDELVSFFAVMVDGKNVFDITITPNRIAEESHILKFRNSLGAYELIEVTGKTVTGRTFSEEDLWESVNEYEVFEQHRSRVSSRKTITVESGYKSKDELNFIIDLIKSDDIYLINPADPLGREYRCFVVPEELSLPGRVTMPQSIKIKLRMATEDMFQSPEITFDKSLPLFQNLTVAGDPRINRYGLIIRDDYTIYSK